MSNTDNIFQIAVIQASQVRIGMRLLSPLHSYGPAALTVRRVVSVTKTIVPYRDIFRKSADTSDTQCIKIMYENNNRPSYFLPEWNLCIAAEEEPEEEQA